jgi:hypothetical protein
VTAATCSVREFPKTYFLLYGFKACSTYRFAAAGAARRKSAAASLPCRRRGE